MAMRRHGFAVACVLMAGLGMAASRSHAADSGMKPIVPGLTVENFPRVNGAVSKGPLMKLLVLRALGMPGCLGRYVDYGPLMVYFPIHCEPQDIQAAYRFVNQSGRLRTDGSHLAYLTLIEGSADVILVPNSPTDDEVETMKTKRVELDVRPMGIDGLVFLVNRQNPVNDLTLDQLRAIFTGKVTNWSAVNGKDEPIKTFIRDPNSGSQELMQDIVLQKAPGVKAEGDMLLSLEGPIDKVARTPNSIAYSLYYYEQFMNRHPQNKLLAINGVKPTRETVTTRAYPLAAEFYVVTRKGLPADAPAAKFRDWVLSEGGQRVIEESGYIPVVPTRPDTPARPGPSRVRDLAK